MTIFNLSTIVFYFAVCDAILIMLFGITVALCFLFGKQTLINTLMERAFSALLTLVGSSVAAAVILAAIRWLLPT